MSHHKEAQDVVVAETGRLQHWLMIGAAMLVAAPAPILRTLEIAGLPHPGLRHEAESILFGISILGAATLLVWATEVAEQLISATLALAVLAIIAVLPEYAVDLYFAWGAADDPEKAQFALANMTGANRLLIGFAWPVVFFIFWFRERQQNLKVGKQNSIGLVLLGVATIYSFTIVIRQHISLIDSAILISVFVVYLVLSSRSPPREEELVGPAESIGVLPIRLRWAVIIGLFVFAAGTVFAAAEPFADGLVESGKSFGIDEFLLVQWVAPLASEAPEFILAAILAFRGRSGAGMTLLISSKVNQWTLLVGSLPVAFSISGTTLSPLDMEAQQTQEVFLTAGQSLFAVAVLASLSFSIWEASLIFVMFTTQLAIPIAEVRVGFGIAYIVLALVWFLKDRGEVGRLLQTARDTAQGPPDDG